MYRRSYTRDATGRITADTEIIEGDTTRTEYAYNDIGYLVQVKKNGAITEKYEYDANGNRTAHLTPSDTVAATYDAQDRMLTYGEARYQYGPRGDLQRKIVGSDTTRYNYDNQGSLRSVTLPGGTHIEYLIDGSGRRVAKKVNGQLTKRWLYAGGLLPIAELDPAGNVETRYGPGYIARGDTTYRVLRDHLGSVRLVVNAQTGEVAQRMDYDAWGNITNLQNEQEFTDIGFAGGLYDRHTGLVRFGARDYDPGVGRWTAKDPILFGGGPSNLYEYVVNDPINKIDKNGLQAISASPKDSSSINPDEVNPNTLYENLFGLHYPGSNNPVTYGGDPDFSTLPASLAGFPAIGHDRRYGNLGIAGASGLIFDTRAVGADAQFVFEQLTIASSCFINKDYRTGLEAMALGVGLGALVTPKSIVALTQPNAYSYIKSWYVISDYGVTNFPSK